MISLERIRTLTISKGNQRSLKILIFRLKQGSRPPPIALKPIGNQWLSAGLDDPDLQVWIITLAGLDDPDLQNEHPDNNGYININNNNE